MPAVKGTRLLRLFADVDDQGVGLLPRACSSSQSNTTKLPSKLVYWARNVVARQRQVEADKGLNALGRQTQRAAEAIAARQGLVKLRVATIDAENLGVHRHVRELESRWRSAAKRKVADASAFEMTAAALLLPELAKLKKEQLGGLIERARDAEDSVTLRALGHAPILLDVPEDIRSAAREAMHVVAAPEERRAFETAQAEVQELEDVFNGIDEDLAGISTGQLVLEGTVDHRIILDGRRRSAVKRELGIVDDEPVDLPDDPDDITPPLERIKHAHATAEA